VGMVAPRQRIASAFFVIHGQYGDVSRYAQERGVCRQWVYREAGWLERVLSERQGELDCLRTRVRELEERQKELERRLSVSVVVDADKQAEFASIAQARGVSLRDCQELLEVLIPGQALSVASLGRRTRAVGEKAGQLLEVLDEFARPKVRESAADEIYVKPGLDGGGTGEPVLDHRSAERGNEQQNLGGGIQAICEARTGDA